MTQHFYLMMSWICLGFGGYVGQNEGFLFALGKCDQLFWTFYEFMNHWGKKTRRFIWRHQHMRKHQSLNCSY